MQSRLFRAVLAWKQEQGVTGGRGNTNPSKFIRLPENIIEEFDGLLLEFRNRYGAYPSSPRNERLFELLDRLDAMFPPGADT